MEKNSFDKADIFNKLKKNNAKNLINNFIYL